VAVTAALLVRIPAITSLPMDWDESIYLSASNAVASAIHTGDWSAIFNASINPEHPGLVKVLYGVGISIHGEGCGLIEQLATVRGMSLLAGLAAVGIAAWVHPVAGLVLATHTLHAKYSCEGYLDALPSFWMASAMVLAWKYRNTPDHRNMILAAACWGAAIAGKWLHGLPGIVLLFFMIDWRVRTRMLLSALAAAWLLDPTMWTNPFGRVVTMLTHHNTYAQSLTVPSTIWTPWAFLAMGGPSEWHPESFPFSIDGCWLVMGLAGMIHGCVNRDSWARYVTAWFGFCLLFLMVWPTRWPQHTMVLLVPLSFGCALAVQAIVSFASLRFAPSDSHRPTSE
jgi:hypothetical protein